MTTFFNRLRRNSKGFTLIELLVVVAIIALLATFAVPKLFDAINKSKKAPGQADLQTISSALERYYMDNNSYPVTGVEAALANGYLKATTTYRNGFKTQYLYGTNAAGSGYFLMDMQDVAVTYAGGTATQTIACTGGNVTFTLTNDGSQAMAVNAAITHDLSTCAAPTGAKVVRN